MENALIEKYLQLPKEIQNQVLDYLEYLINKYKGESKLNKNLPKKSNFGNSREIIEMSDDFDKPISDFKDYI